METNTSHNKDDDSLTPLLAGTMATLNEHDGAHDTTLGNTSTFDQKKHQVDEYQTTLTVSPVAATSSNAAGPTLVAPPTTTAISKNTLTPSEDQKTCRICGEGEEEEEEDTGYSDYDEESQIRNPESAPFMTRYQSSNSGSNSSSNGVPRNNKKWIQQKNPLIRPCRCKGTMMYVHVSCLNRWRNLSPRASSYVACDLCGYQYNIYRPRYAAIVTNVHFLRLMTAFLVLLSILTCAYLCKLVDIYLFGHLPRPDNKDWVDIHGPTWLWMDRFYLFAGLIVISLLGMVYLTFLCVSRPYALGSMTQQQQEQSFGGGQGSLFCCDQASCPWYSCYLADVAACSGDAAAGGFLVFLVLMSLLAILFGILGAVTGVYRWMEACVERVAGHVKERILDVD